MSATPVRRRRSPLHPPRSHLARSVRGSAIRELLALTERPEVFSLAGGLPATDLIPGARIAAAVQETLGDPATLQYTASAGDSAARRAVARFENVSEIGQVLLAHGSQQALSLVAAALLDPGDVVVVDDPGYVGALQAFGGVGADLRGLPLTDGGIDTETLHRWCAQGMRPRLVHTVASFHNPGGMCADAPRRADLVRLADRYGFWIVDDDPYGRLRFRGTPTPPMREFGERVLTLGSASKILAPALRVGWLIAPPAVIDDVERLRQGADLCGSTLAQTVVARLVDDAPWMSAHLDRLRSEYRRRAQALVTGLRTELGDAIEIGEAEGGMFCWARLPGVDTSALLATAVEHGVAYVPGAAFAVDAGHQDRLRMSFATCTPDELAEAARRLGRVVHGRAGL